MDHNEAITGGFTERYLLGELDSAQRDRFEEHFFECPLCADDVETGAAFIDNARSILRSQEAPPSALRYPKFGLPFQTAALAATCLAAFVGYQNVVTIPAARSHSSPGARPAELVSPVSLIGMGARAESQAVVIPRANEILLSLDVPGGPDFASYTFEVLNAKNEMRVSVPIPAEKAKDAVSLTIPGSDLPPGSYEFVVVGRRLGEGTQELSRVPAIVK